MTNEIENQTGRVLELRLDPGGPITILESDEGGLSKGILLDIHACNNADCKYRDAHLTVVDIDDRKTPFARLKNRKTISSDTAERMLKSKSALSLRLRPEI